MCSRLIALSSLCLCAWAPVFWTLKCKGSILNAPVSTVRYWYPPTPHPVRHLLYLPSCKCTFSTAASRLAQQQQQQQQQQRVLAGLTESRGRKVDSPAATSTAGTTHIAQNNTGHNTDCAEHTTYTTHSDTHWTEWLESGGRSIAAVDQLSCVCRGSNKTQLTRKHKTTTKTRKYKNNNTEHKHTCLHWDAGLVAVGGKTRFLEVLSVVLCCNEMIAF